MNKKLVLGLSLLITMNMHGALPLEKCAIVLGDLLVVYQQQLRQQECHLEEVKTQTELQRRQAEEQAKQTANFNAILSALLEGNVRLVTALEKVGQQLGSLGSIVSRSQTDGVRATLALEALVDGQKNQVEIQREQVGTLQALVALETRIVDDEMTSLRMKIDELEEQFASGRSKRRSLRKKPTARAQSAQASQPPLELLEQLPPARPQSTLSSSGLSVHSSVVSDDGDTDDVD